MLAQSNSFKRRTLYKYMFFFKHKNFLVTQSRRALPKVLCFEAFDIKVFWLKKKKNFFARKKSKGNEKGEVANNTNVFHNKFLFPIFFSPQKHREKSQKGGQPHTHTHTQTKTGRKDVDIFCVFPNSFFFVQSRNCFLS